jgi:hypothetical protein
MKSLFLSVVGLAFLFSVNAQSQIPPKSAAPVANEKKMMGGCCEKECLFGTCGASCNTGTPVCRCSWGFPVCGCQSEQVPMEEQNQITALNNNTVKQFLGLLNNFNSPSATEAAILVASLARRLASNDKKGYSEELTRYTFLMNSLTDEQQSSVTDLFHKIVGERLAIEKKKK